VGPTRGGGAVLLAAPIFDHAKVAIVDAIARLGLPAGNPFFATPGNGHLAYYYWWHLAAAELSRGIGVGGWTADAALTWFTGFATLMLVAGIGQALARPGVGLVAMLLMLPGSVRPLLRGVEQAGWLLPSRGLDGWLNQAAWAPQHLAAGGLLVVAVLLLAGLAEGSGLAGVTALGLVVAAGFGSSAWVGGIVCAIGLPVAAVVVAARLPAAARRGFVARCAVAAVIAVVLVSPLLRDQWAASLARGGAPVRLEAYGVFGAAVGWRRMLDPVGFPLLLLIDFPVLAVLGTLGVVRALRGRAPAWQVALIATGLVGVGVCWGLRSTIDNNDLGWRAMLPALLALTPFAAAEAWRCWSARGGHAVLATAPLVGLVGSWALLREDWTGHPAASGGTFAAEAAMWREVRRVVGPAERVASDPRMDGDMTLWPGNIGWALLADRSACYAGWATVHPFAAVPTAGIYADELALRRVFDGAPGAGDLGTLVALGCRYALVTARSPAWQHDPFTGAAGGQLVGGVAGAWRLYRLQ
jgi:hypothetical protein